MAGSGKTKKELLEEVEDLRRQLAAAERDCQLIVKGLQEERRSAEIQWQQRVEGLEKKLAAYVTADTPLVSEVVDCWPESRNRRRSWRQPTKS